MITVCFCFPSMEDIMLSEKDSAHLAIAYLTLSVGLIAGGIFGYELRDMEAENYLLIIPKDTPVVKEAINSGVSEKQLVAAFQGAAPVITKKEIERLRDLYGGGLPTKMSEYDAPCEKALKGTRIRDMTPIEDMTP